LSVIVPFYNEKGNLGRLHKEILFVLGKLRQESEIVYVDDGSQDGSAESLRVAIKKEKSKRVKVKLVVLRRNFGQTAASVAGLEASRGEVVSFLDADLQNDPSDILRLLESMEDCDAVFGWRKRREDGSGRKIVSWMANFLLRKLFNVPLHDAGCSVRVVKREIMERINLYGEMHRLLPVLILLQGIKYKEIVVSHRPRTHQHSKYGYSRIVKLMIDLMTVKFFDSYSTKPAYIFGSVGIGCNLMAAIAALWVLYRKIFDGIYVHRNPVFLIAVFLSLIGIQFVLMGLLAEMMVRVYFESRTRQVYQTKRLERY